MTLEVASKNLVCSVALTGILALQAGREWAESKDRADETEDEIDDTLGPVSRGRRRSHHDHLEVEEEVDRPPSPRKRDGSYRKRKSASSLRR